MADNGLIQSLKVAQKCLGWNNRRLAAEFGVSPSLVTRVYNGERLPNMRFLTGILVHFPDLQQEALDYFVGLELEKRGAGREED